MADQRVLVTYDCLHFAVLPTFYLDSTENYESTFTHFAKSGVMDLCEHPPSAHLAIPGKCPSPECSNCNTYAVLHSELTTRHELLLEFETAFRLCYTESGQSFHAVDLLIRSRNEKKSRCELAMLHFQKETSEWHEDGLLLPAFQVRCTLALCKQGIEHLSKSRSMSNADRVRLARQLNDGLMSASKATKIALELRCGVDFLAEEEKGLSKAYRKAAEAKQDHDHSKANFGVIGAMNSMRLAWEKRMKGSMFASRRA